MKKKIKAKKTRKPKKGPWDLITILTVVSVVAAIVALLLAVEANKLSERSLLISNTQFEEASIPQYLLNTNSIFSTTEPKFVTEELWCELVDPTNGVPFRPFIQLLVDSGMNNDEFGTLEASKKDLILYALAQSFSEESYSKDFVNPAEELALRRKTPQWSFSNWLGIRLHALVRNQTVYYHVVQDYDAQMIFSISNGLVVDFTPLKFQFNGNKKFNHLQKFEDFAPFQTIF